MKLINLHHKIALCVIAAVTTEDKQATYGGELTMHVK